MSARLTYGSVCSGIEAATAAWHPLGWKPAFFSEIEAFPRAVLAHHYPEVPLHGDFTTIEAGQYEPIDLLVGGTPCQSFSIAGLRGGLDDDRGNLALEYLRLAQRLRPRWLVWENVPGVLSSNGGRDFGTILGGMVELGYGFAYRVLDARGFGVPQLRRRVFIVAADQGDWRRASAVLFERECLSWRVAPIPGDYSPCLDTGIRSLDRASSSLVVLRNGDPSYLLPEECEQLQGFTRGYTAIPWRGKPAAGCPDGPRYKALGNSMAVPCMAWIGQRIAAVEALSLSRAAA